MAPPRPPQGASDHPRKRQCIQNDDRVKPSTPQKRQRVQSNNRVDPSAPLGGSPSKKRLTNIPKQVVDSVCRTFRKLISPKDDDDEIRDVLHYVWTGVRDALEQDPNLKRHLASKKEFYDNVTRKGEKTFIESLRTMAANSDTQGNKAWEDLFEDGTSFSLGPSILIEFSV